MRSGVPAFCLLMLAIPVGPLHASGIYKWVDAQGVIHYSATPPPPAPASDNGQTPRVQELKPIEQPDDKYGANSGVRGSWWGVMDGHTTELRLKHDKFYFTRSLPRGGTHSELHGFAEGKYRYHDNQLELDFFRHALEPDKIDKVERYEVLYLDGQQLHLLKDHREKLIFKRFATGLQSQIARDLRGKWRDTVNKGVLYEFAPGTLTLYREQAYGGLGKRRIATWEWEDPELLIDYVADFLKPLNPATAHLERWSLQEKSANRMRWLNTGTGQILDLERTQ